MHLTDFLKDQHSRLEHFYEYCIQQSDMPAAVTAIDWEEFFAEWSKLENPVAKYGRLEAIEHAKARILSEQLREACRDLDMPVYAYPMKTRGFTSGCLCIRIEYDTDDMTEPPSLVAWHIVQEASKKLIPTDRIVKALNRNEFNRLYNSTSGKYENVIYFPNAPYWKNT